MREVRENQYSLVLNKRRTYPWVYFSLLFGSSWIIIYLIPVTMKFLQLESAAAQTTFLILETVIEFGWIYSLLLRVVKLTKKKGGGMPRGSLKTLIHQSKKKKHIAFWDVKITQAREQCKWYELIDDKVPPSFFMKYESTYGNVDYVGLRVLVIITISSLLSLPALLLPASAPAAVKGLFVLFYVVLHVVPWSAVFLMALCLPRSEDPYFLREELQRIFVCVVSEVSTILIIIAVVGFNRTGLGSNNRVGAYATYALTCHCLALCLFLNMYFMSSWVIRTLRQRKLLQFRVSSAPPLNDLHKWHTEEVLKAQGNAEFTLEQVVSQPYGFDLLMRQMTDQWCHGVCAFYDIECFQWMIIQDLRQEEYVNIKGCCLLGFNKNLPKSWIIRRPIWIDIFYKDGRKQYNVLELTEEEYAERVQEEQRKSSAADDAAIEQYITYIRTEYKTKTQISIYQTIQRGLRKASKSTPLEIVKQFRKFSDMPVIKDILKDDQKGKKRVEDASDAKSENEENERDVSNGEDDERRNDNEKEIHHEDAESDTKQPTSHEKQIEYEKKVIEYKIRAFYIFEKYIHPSSRHEINICGPSRDDYCSLFASREIWMNNTKYHTKHKLLHIFDKVKLEIGKLVSFGFQQFRLSSRYATFVSKVHEAEDGGV
ncbi:hypothetical protein RFI_02823 [Reticulomyxa filosa]|uniref:RGS domain-containing protein n=1 Tax=Reticulomyxa filosa TaxID=46433 RepID=X6P9F7_RETFI|nr:hypothetical protein RFI_02823 [Reticulomyxa filosa]|eukprot:ETO34267.1 hypothetical protein RFI_02823 [Reticulomyxa filosa]